MYLPLLKRYNELPMHYSRFEVDIRLKRYDSALSNLSKSGSIGEDPSKIPTINGTDLPTGND